MKPYLALLAFTTACAPRMVKDYSVEIHPCTELQNDYLQRSREILSATPGLLNLKGYKEHDRVKKRILNGEEGKDYKCATFSTDNVGAHYSTEGDFIVLSDIVFEPFDLTNMDCRLNAPFSWKAIEDAYAYEGFMGFFGYRNTELDICMNSYAALLGIQGHEYMHGQGKGPKYNHSEALDAEIDRYHETVDTYGEESEEADQAHDDRMEIQSDDYVYSYHNALIAKLNAVSDLHYLTGEIIVDEAFDSYLTCHSEWDSAPYDHIHDLITDERTNRMSECYTLDSDEVEDCIFDVRNWYDEQVDELHIFSNAMKEAHRLECVENVNYSFFGDVMDLYPSLTGDIE